MKEICIILALVFLLGGATVPPKELIVINEQWLKPLAVDTHWQAKVEIDGEVYTGGFMIPADLRGMEWAKWEVNPGVVITVRLLRPTQTGIPRVNLKMLAERIEANE